MDIFAKVIQEIKNELEIEIRVKLIDEMKEELNKIRVEELAKLNKELMNIKEEELNNINRKKNELVTEYEADLKYDFCEKRLYKERELKKELKSEYEELIVFNFDEFLSKQFNIT